MSLAFRRYVFVIQVISLVILYGLCVGLACIGLPGLALAWGFCGTMIAEPWGLRWPTEPTDESAGTGSPRSSC